MKHILPVTVILFSALAASAAPGARITLHSGLVISRSETVERRVYRIPNADETGLTAAITIRGSDFTVDFGGATLEGSDPTVEPDQRGGTGIRVEGRNVTLKNLRVRGYKIGLISVDSPGIKILNCDLSYNWKQHLGSTLDQEDESDWMSFHQNEKDEWLRYGAGIYLRRCEGFEVKGVTIRGGQCGLMLMESSKGLAYNNNFSFLSGVGLGMYRSSDNRIMHNRIDWCVRGYSHGVYNRGQDSAGILIYEQSSRNTFAYNSVTHGGDGFFLWAGQTTMDTGEGGCNDNLVYGNDFSHAPTNGIEATFSRNTFANNLVMECWHGIWGGYSYNTRMLGNVFAYNAESIAIEHGQHNAIRGNLFFREGTAIHVWQNEKQDPNWGYPKHHDTVSHDYDVSGNLFTQITQGSGSGGSGVDVGTALRLKATSDFRLGENRYGPLGTLYDLRGPFTSFHFAGAMLPSAANREQKVSDRDSDTFRFRPPLDMPSLGTGWDAAHEGHDMSPGAPQGLLPPLMQPSGNLILPYPESIRAYPRRFQTNWNPLKPQADSAVSIGDFADGRRLMTLPQEALKLAPAPLPDGMDPFLPQETAYRGRGYILVDQWGPYDFRSPLIRRCKGVVRRISPESAPLEQFEILGPKGKWSAVKVEGGTLSASSGTVPGFVEFLRDSQGGGRVKIELAYTGGKVVDYRGIEKTARPGSPILFQYTEFSVPIQWHVRFYKYDKTTQEPRTQPEAFRALIAGKPLAEQNMTSLDLTPGHIPGEVGNDYFATVADGEFEIEPGDYLIDATTDDGARVTLDGKLLVDEWKYQGPTLYTREVHLGGKHKLHIEHFQIDGYWTLKLAIRPKNPD